LSKGWEVAYLDPNIHGTLKPRRGRLRRLSPTVFLRRITKVTVITIAMLNNMPKTGEYMFNAKPDTIRTGFTKQRSRTARRLQNPKLTQIHLHTLRHWKATMEHDRTKNIKYV